MESGMTIKHTIEWPSPTGRGNLTLTVAEDQFGALVTLTSAPGRGLEFAIPQNQIANFQKIVSNLKG